MKKRTDDRLVITEKLIIREKTSGFSTSITEFKVDVNEKLNIAHSRRENIARLTARAFISHTAFFS